MIILGIETSCDETSAAVVSVNETSQEILLLSNVTASSLTLHAKTGGIIPEIAAREQIKYILPVIQEALRSTPGVDAQTIDAIAVTYGPGLIGSLLVGVETARTLSYLWNKPLIPVNHLYGHIYANWLTTNGQGPKTIDFPALALVVSGGHTDLVLMKSHKKLEVVGSTRDDAAGEAFDKTGRLLGLAYPAGSVIARLSEKGNPKAYQLPRPMHNSGDFDFSFSGLKTAVLREVKSLGKPTDKQITDLCASIQQAIVDILVKKTLDAAKKYNTKSILLGGGVAANKKLRDTLSEKSELSAVNCQLFVPEAEYCTDNAAMIAAAAYFQKKEIPWQEFTADPELYYE